MVWKYHQITIKYLNYNVGIRKKLNYLALKTTMEKFASIAAMYAEKSDMTHMHGCIAVFRGRYIVAQSCNQFRQKGKDRLFGKL